MEIASAYEDFLFDENRIVILYGGAGSGKSYTVAIKILTRMRNEPGHRFLVIRKVAAGIRETVLEQFINIIDAEGISGEYLIQTSPPLVQDLKTGSEIIFLGLDNPEKIKSITAITGIWIEEATELEIRDFRELNRRLRGITKFYKQIILSFNPISINHWLRKAFFLDEVKNCSIYHTTYLDNPFIDKEYKNILETEADENDRKVYTEGRMGTNF